MALTRGKRWLLGILLVLTALGLGGVAWVRSLSDGIDYSGVPSIRKLAEYQDAALLARAMALPVAALYRSGGLQYQRNPSFCGPASVVDVLRSLGISAEQATVLNGTSITTWFGFVLPGATLDELASVVRHHGRKATILRDFDLEEFRTLVATSNDPARRYIVNFHRGPLFAGGGGHHSPIGGYLADRDLVLVFDVNKSYQPWLVPTERLFAAVHTVDSQTKQGRGLLLVE